MTPDIPLEVQLGCARRELALRGQCYPRWVASGKMPALKAEQELQAMEAIVATLTRLHEAAQLQLFAEEAP